MYLKIACRCHLLSDLNRISDALKVKFHYHNLYIESIYRIKTELKSLNLDKELQKFEIEFKKGFSKPLILCILAEKPDYPFQISKRLREKTKDKIKIEGSNIYPILKSLEQKEGEEGLIIGVKEEDSRKRIYSLTDDGKKFLRSLQLSMDEFIQTIREMIDT
jgi:PadR family transcriptional regulator PadR